MPDFRFLSALALTVSVISACGGSADSPAPSLPIPMPPPANTVPTAPILDSVTAGDGRAALNFTAPTSDGGSAITGYTATCRAGANARTTDGATSPITLTSLANDTAYECTVLARNAVGESAESAALSVTPMAPPVTEPGTSYFTAALGWVPGEDVSSKMDAFLSTIAEPGDTLVVEAMYFIAGSDYDLAEGFTLRGGLSEQAAGFSSLDGTRELADRNGIPYNNDPVFDVGPHVRIENLTFTQDEINPLNLVSGGIKGGWFEVEDVDGFQFIGNKIDTKGWTGVKANDADDMLFEGNTFDSPKAGLSMGNGDGLRFIYNFGTGGYEATRIGGEGTNSFMDVIKTTRTDVGPTNAVITGNVFADIVRDAIDTTGGFANANIYDNAFAGIFAGLDLKSIYDRSRGTDDGLVANTNINISENVFFDVNNAVVTTTLFRDDEVPSLDFAVQDIHSQNNTYSGGSNAFLIKNSRAVFGQTDYFVNVNPFRLIDAYGIGNDRIEIDESLRDGRAGSRVDLDMAVQATGVSLDYLSVEDIQTLNVWFLEQGAAQRADYLTDQSESDAFIDAFTANDQINYGTPAADVMEVGDGLDIIDMGAGDDSAIFVRADNLLDVIQNFGAGDVIDLNPVLDFNAGDTPSAFVRIVERGEQTVLQINPAGQGDAFTSLAIFQTEVARSVEQLLADGALVLE